MASVNRPFRRRTSLPQFLAHGLSHAVARLAPRSYVKQSPETWGKPPEASGMCATPASSICFSSRSGDLKRDHDVAEWKDGQHLTLANRVVAAVLGAVVSAFRRTGKIGADAA